MTRRKRRGNERRVGARRGEEEGGVTLKREDPSKMVGDKIANIHKNLKESNLGRPRLQFG